MPSPCHSNTIPNVISTAIQFHPSTLPTTQRGAGGRAAGKPNVHLCINKSRSQETGKNKNKVTSPRRLAKRPRKITNCRLAVPPPLARPAGFPRDPAMVPPADGKNEFPSFFPQQSFQKLAFYLILKVRYHHFLNFCLKNNCF